MKISIQNWKNIYLWGGISAFLSLSLTLLDISLTMIPGWEPSTVPDNLPGWFSQFQSNPWLGFRNLDFLNMIVAVISIMLLLALFGVFRQKSYSYATLAFILGLIGATLIVANNAALPMLELSQKYPGATETDKIVLVAAGESLLARGEHGSKGIFIAFLLSSLGTLLMSVAMLDSKEFKRSAGWAGIIGMIFLIAYTIGTTFIQQIGDEIIALIAIPGGLLIIYWYVVVGRQLLRMYLEEESD
jgi:hypothetical protein